MSIFGYEHEYIYIYTKIKISAICMTIEKMFTLLEVILLSITFFKHFKNIFDR